MARERTIEEPTKEKDMKRTVSILTAALFVSALAMPAFAQAPSPGAPGATGATGATGETGATGATGAPGAPAPAAEAPAPAPAPEAAPESAATEQKEEMA